MKAIKAVKRAVGLMAVASALIVVPAEKALAQAGRVKSSAASEPDANPGQVGNGGFLGVFLSDVNEARAKDLKLSEARGALVGQVVKDSPAAKAGLQENDVVLGFNSEQVQSAAQLHRLLLVTPPGRLVNLGIGRDGRIMTVPATLGERQAGMAPMMSSTPDIAEQMRLRAEEWKQESENLRQQFERNGDRKLLDKSEELKQQSEDFFKRAEEQKAEAEKFRKEGQLRGFPKSDNATAASRPRPGFKVIQLGEQLGRYFSVPGNTGLLVTEVEPGGLASRAGLKAGDCLFEVNGQKVQSRDDALRLISEAGEQAGSGKQSEVPLKIMRDHQEQTLRLELVRP